jgi:secreted PhoX family phosphatase
MPFETGTGGVQRVDLWDNNYNTRTVTIVAPGTQGFVSGDASRWTPWGSYLTAEESWGTGSTKGRLFEVTNATTAGANGANFVSATCCRACRTKAWPSTAAKSLYFIDELNGGSIYKYVSANPNASTGDQYFNKGQTFVLKVGAGGQFEGNNGPAITGAASWVAITTATGTPTQRHLQRDARTSAAAASPSTAAWPQTSSAATGYNRPEDLEIQDVNGNERMYFATTDSDIDGNGSTGTSRVYFLDLASNEVKLFADPSTIDLATGLAVGGGLRSSDNLAIDADGNIYIIEDRNGGVDNDIWFAKDINKDGDLLDAGEGLGRWASATARRVQNSRVCTSTSSTRTRPT